MEALTEAGAGDQRSLSTAATGVSSRSDPARRILAAADDLFYRQGAKATTVREITGACGLTPGALYNHFASKEELLYELVVYRHRRLDEHVEAALATLGPDPVARLAAVVRTYLEVHVRGRRGSRVANREYPNLTGPRLDEVIAVRRRLRDRVIGILEEGESQGVFDLPGGAGHPAAVVAAAAILDLCVHTSEWLTDDGTFSTAELADLYVVMALRMVSAGSGR